MAEYNEDDELRRLKAIWDEYWKPVVGGIVIGLGGIVGWQAFQDHRVQTAKNASTEYRALLSAVRDGNDEQALLHL